ncbi:MAG: hypothetical protein KAQ62_20305 [Cyclobacteriaceae bacterium]|nr:hypothetical protein [Cyclobacteriaceae bacterium]
MKQLFILSTVLICFVSTAKAQECDIQIQILEDKYMFGQASIMDDKEPVKKMKVNFTSEVMEVVLPVDGQNYLIKVVNQDCQAYCTKAKRVRQLHSGDEKLVRNLFKNKKEDILAQIRACKI